MCRPIRLASPDGPYGLRVLSAYHHIEFFYRSISSTIRAHDEEIEHHQGRWQVLNTGDVTAHPHRAGLDYRTPTLVLSPPNDRYDVMIRVASTSALILHLQIWQPDEFTRQALQDTAFWSFYFGLAMLSTLLALILALILKAPLFWATLAFSASYFLVACVQGFVAWVVPSIGLALQHYLTSILTLSSYATLLWMATESLNLRERKPYCHLFFIVASWVTLFHLIAVPFGLSGQAIHSQSLIYLITAGVFLWALLDIWWEDRFSLVSLFMGVGPLLCILASLTGLMTVFGWLPFSESVYRVWQYAPIINMLLVMGLAMIRIYQENQLSIERKQLMWELNIEREAHFHQRQFMGMVSHEFRTPLSVISGAVSNLKLMSSEWDDGVAKRYTRIERAAERLIQLTDNCLADARLSAQALDLHISATDLKHIVQAGAGLLDLSDHHQLQLIWEGKVVTWDQLPELPLQGDEALWRIVMSNLLDNAVKYMDSGVVIVEICKKSKHYIVYIEDQGPGIAPEYVDQIFERYKRAPSEQAAIKASGVGLGLYLSRQIAQAHGGTLALVSEPTEGCRFELTLPMVVSVPQ